MLRKSNKVIPDHVLARVNFPLYVVKNLTERHILIAGGGGQAKTGILNSIEIYELFKCPNSDTCRARRVTHLDTGTRAIMNATIFQKGDNFILATGGMEGLCVLYKLSLELEKLPSFDQEDNKNSNKLNNLVNRKVKKEKSNLPNGNAIDNDKKLIDQELPNLCFKINKVTDFKADFNDNSKEGSYLKSIRYSSSTKLLVTGGSDGCIRLYGYPDLKMIYSIKAHKNEIDDIDIDNTGNKLISISRDNHCYIWNLKDRSKFKELSLNNKEVKYDFRCCKFGIVADNPTVSVLYTLHNPITRTKPPSKTLICKWNTKSFDLEKIVLSGFDSFSTIAVSDDGKFIGTGLSSGTVEIYIAFSLQKIYSLKNAHSIFVTRVEFLSSSFETKMLSGDQEASLVSISVDNQLIVHHVPKQDKIGFLGSSILFIFTICLFYIFFSLIDF